jgi:hypothetical protein
VRGPDRAWATLALALLERAVADWGVGAKTSSGYGRLDPVGDVRHGAGRGPSITPSRPEAQATPTTTPPPSDPFPAASPSPRAVSLAQEVMELPTEGLNERIHSYYERWKRLGEGPERVDVARALTRKLTAAGLLKRQNWLARSWVQELIRYVNTHQ